MTTVSQAFTAIRTRLEANPITGLPLRWQNEQPTDLPDEPSAFAYVELLTDRTYIAGFGGGRGSNLWRTEGELQAHVYVPVQVGLTVATDYAEQIAALFRGYRDSDISCFAAHVEPGSQDETDGNYWAAHAIIALQFDLVG